jgi:hypothetical protein
MRLLVALAVLLLTLTPTLARPDGDICHWADGPKPETPNIPYDVFYVSRQGMAEGCENDHPLLWGCYRGDRSYAQIYIFKDMHPAMRHCVLFHEYGHAPPNNWTHD